MKIPCAQAILRLLCITVPSEPEIERPAPPKAKKSNLLYDPAKFQISREEREARYNAMVCRATERWEASRASEAARASEASRVAHSRSVDSADEACGAGSA